MQRRLRNGDYYEVSKMSKRNGNRLSWIKRKRNVNLGREKIFCNFFTKRDALKHGAINIRVGNGVTNDRTRAWACRECKFVVIDCN